MDDPARSHSPRRPDREIFVADEQHEVAVDVARYAALAHLVLSREKVREDTQLSLAFVDEATMADLHERFLGLEGPTDVLAFPMGEELVESGRQPDAGGRGPGVDGEQEGAPILLGDVVVCPQVAERQAEEAGHSTEEELEALVVHGILHLLDYDHAEEEAAARMRRREQELLQTFRLGR